MTLRRRPRAPSPTLPLSPLLPPASRVLACSVAPGFERFPAANVTRFEPRARACAVPVHVSGDVMERMTRGVSAVARASFASCRGLSGQRPGALVLALARVRRSRRRQRRQLTPVPQRRPILAAGVKRRGPGPVIVCSSIVVPTTTITVGQPPHPSAPPVPTPRAVEMVRGVVRRGRVLWKLLMLLLVVMPLQAGVHGHVVVGHVCYR